jgi:hypothetical protein
MAPGDVGCVKRFRADTPALRLTMQFDDPCFSRLVTSAMNLHKRAQPPVCQRLKRLDTPYILLVSLTCHIYIYLVIIYIC